MIAWYRSECKRRKAEEEAKADSAESILLEAFGEKPNILGISAASDEQDGDVVTRVKQPRVRSQL